MPDMIRDGKGRGYLVMVDNENCLQTKCVSESMVAHRSHYDGSAYGISTPLLTITTTGGRMLWIKNTSTKALFFTDFWFNWNGGNTNYNRPMYGNLVFGDTQPDTNIIVGGAGILNQNKISSAELTVLYWDGTGDGMTGHSSGNSSFYWCNAQGSMHYHLDGSIILGTNKTISMNLQGEEIGQASINILGFFKEEH